MATYDILPYPDAAVFASVRLRIDWLLETCKLDAVVERIRAGHDGWPRGRRGKVPVPLGSSVYRAGTPIEWEDVSAGAVYDLAASPSVYGIYSYYAAALAATAASAPTRRRRPTKGAHQAIARAREKPPLPDARALMTMDFGPLLDPSPS